MDCIILLWNYYLVEAAYTYDFQREWHHDYVFASDHAADVMWTTWNDKTMEDELHRGSQEDAVASVVDRKILSGYLAMRALDFDTVLELARDATSSFEQGTHYALLHEDGKPIAMSEKS